jgi:hypothetical protein
MGVNSLVQEVNKTIRSENNVAVRRIAVLFKIGNFCLLMILIAVNWDRLAVKDLFVKFIIYIDIIIFALMWQRWFA